MDRLQAAEQMRKALQMFAASLSETDALIIASVYPEWDENHHAYKTGEWVKYGVDELGDSRLYQVLQDHTSQSDWTPDTANSLYKRVGVSADGTPVWVQPVGASDSYTKGDIVMYNDVKYISIINANVWAPDVYGWEVYDESETGGDTDNTDNTDSESGTSDGGKDTEVESDIPEFVQPTGAHNAYMKGDKVKYNGKIYESLIDNNVYAPDIYPAGWQEVAE